MAEQLIINHGRKTIELYNLDSDNDIEIRVSDSVDGESVNIYLNPDDLILIRKHLDSLISK